MSELIQNNQERRDTLRSIIKGLKDSTDAQNARKEFKTFLKSVSAEEIASIEQSLIEEGIPVSEVQNLCEVHVELYEKSLAATGTSSAVAGHPIETYKRENKELKKRLKVWHRSALRFVRQIGKTGEKKTLDEFLELLADLSKVEFHYTRKENQLFPFLETIGFTGPSKVMWGKHDEIRNLMKQSRELALKKNEDLKSISARTAALMGKMIFMEERILFPTALRKLPQDIWAQIRSGESAIGYSWITPSNLYDPAVVRTVGNTIIKSDQTYDKKPDISSKDMQKNSRAIPLETGALMPEALNLMLTNLPLDVSYVDENDTVLYYSEGRSRIFPRSPGIIGRKVQNCHPPKSVDTVQKILDSFKKKRKSEASFWIQMGEKFILIQYFALHDKDGNYKGVIEVSQDATWIRSLQGERRLLEWQD